MIGIILGTGIWAGWEDVLRIQGVLEAHIHAQNWGFITLVFSGLLLDLYPKFAKTSIHWPSSVKYILSLQTFAAFALVLSPWIGSVPVAVVGMLSFIIGKGILLLNIILPLRGKDKDIGFLHIVLGYVWIFAPLLFSPFLILNVPGFGYIEPNAPQALIYGWVLQVGYALIPFVLGSIFNSNKIKLGGCIFSVITINLGSLFLWLSIFIRSNFELLQAIAYILWAISFIPIIIQSYNIVNQE